MRSKKNDDIVGELNYKSALSIIKKEELRGNNPIPDLLSFQHVSRLYGKSFNGAFNNYYDYFYDKKNIRDLLRIDVPKSNFTIRPMARPHLEEWIIFEACINKISNNIIDNHNDICSRSYSILRYKNKQTKTTKSWIEFDNKARELYHKDFNSVVVTDITGYYENINLEELRLRIFNFINENEFEVKKATDTLFNLLRKWSQERIPNFGLPQGPVGSSFLGDLYLDHVDRKMEKYDGYFRYMDDIKIFCKNILESKNALKDLIIALRELKLNINSKKTSILNDNDIELQLFDPHHELINLIVKSIDTKNKGIIEKDVIPSLIKLFDESFTGTVFEKRYLNFSIYRLGILYNSDIQFDYEYVINKIFNLLEKKPHHTGLFCHFLSNFNNRIDVFNRILSFLQSDENIYEWQELKLLQCLLKFDIKSSVVDKHFFFKHIKDHNKHFSVKCFYLLLSGKYGNNRDRDLLIELYDENDNDYIKMALILGIQELGIPSRNAFYSRLLKNENELIQNFIKYVKGLISPLYQLIVEKPKIETYIDFDYNVYGL